MDTERYKFEYSLFIKYVIEIVNFLLLRFSLLLLEPSEIYFEDFYTTLKDCDDEFGNKGDSQCLGHLKLCSKSLVFVPKNNQMQLIKIPYKDCDKIIECEATIHSDDNNILSITTSNYIEMLSGNILSAYKFVAKKRTFLFHFHFARVFDYLQQICQLHRASSLDVHAQNSMVSVVTRNY